MLAIGSIIREKAQKKDFAGNSWWKFSATFLVTYVFPDCLLKDALWGKWGQPFYNASVRMRKTMKPEQQHTLRHTVMQRFESSHNFITLNN